MAEKYENHPAVAKARNDLARAYTVTDDKYHHFITEIPNKVRVGGTRDRPETAWVRNPYMTVDGRLTMFIDDMAAQKLRYSIDAESATFGDHQAIKASITIYYEHGPCTVSGLSSINFGGSGVDRTNALENADTSALGRALGKLGYGLFGYGIASADEVEDAKTRQAGLDDASPPARERSATPQQIVEQSLGPAPPPAQPTAKPPSDRQQAFLRDLWEQLGTSEADIAKNVAKITTAQEASEMIGALQQALRDKAQPPKEKSTQIKEVTALLAYAQEHNMMDRLQGMKLEHLTAATAQEMHESMRKDVAEHFATEGAKQDRDPWTAEQDAQEDMGFNDRVPDMTRRPA